MGHLVFRAMSLPKVILPVCTRSSTPKKKVRNFLAQNSYVLIQRAFCVGVKYGVGKATILKVVHTEYLSNGIGPGGHKLHCIQLGVEIGT